MVNIMGPRSFQQYEVKTNQATEEEDDDDDAAADEEKQYKTGCFSLQKINNGDGGSRTIRIIRKGKHVLGTLKTIIPIDQATAAADDTLTSFDLKMLKHATDNFSRANTLGQGGFGIVYKGVLRNGKEIAVKRLSRSVGQGVEEFRLELKAMSTLKHPNIISFLGYYNKGGEHILVYEYMRNGSLDNALFAGTKNSTMLTLSWGTRVSICIGVAKALAFFHEESKVTIIHRDIKPSNVLLDGDLNPKISDFGLARLFREAESLGCTTTRIAGTYGYMPPEYLQYGKVTKKLDVYSFGVCILELMSGKRIVTPGQNLLSLACDLQKTGDLLQLIDRNIWTNDSVKEAKLMLDLAMLCTSFCPTVRPTMTEVVSILEGKIIMKIPLILPDQENHTEANSDWNYSGSVILTGTNDHSTISTPTEGKHTAEDNAPPSLSSADIKEYVYEDRVSAVNTPLQSRVDGENTQNAFNGDSRFMVDKDDVSSVRENVATSESVSRSTDRSCTRLYMDVTELVDKLKLEYVGPSFKQGKFHIDCSEEEFHAGCTEWKDSLVGWFVDDKLSPSNVDKEAVERLWELTGDVSIFSLENGYFLFQYTSAEDKIIALESTPWFIYGRPLVLRKWDWMLKLDKIKMMETLPIWVKIYDLPLYLWSPSFFSKVGSSLGIPLYSDRITINKQRLSFARLCIEVDATKGLPDTMEISVRGIDYKLHLKYDWKPLRCATCCNFGHIESECQLTNMKRMPC